MKQLSSILQQFFWVTSTNILLAMGAAAQPAQLLKDINTTTKSTSFGLDYAQINGILYYSADNNNGSGTELWRTDGTTNGTYMVKDIWGGMNSGGPVNFNVVGNRLTFRASNGNFGSPVLFISDGTAAGTKPLLGAWDSNVKASFKGQLYFVSGGTDNTFHVRRTDNTGYGTSLFFQTPNAMFTTGLMMATDSFLYFSTTDVSSITQLWRTDGTPSGTILLTTINIAFGIENPSIVGNKLFFWVNDPNEGYELWVTDGSVEHTVLVKDFEPGIADLSPWDYTASDTHLYFRKEVSGNYQFWKSNGTAAGTILVDPYVDNYNIFFTYSGGKIYCYAGNTLKVSDGSSPFQSINLAGPSINNWGFQYLFPFDGKVYFSAQTQDTGMEPWVSDGTSSGTHRIADYYAGTDGSTPTPVTVFNNQLLWTAKDRQYGNELRYLVTGTNELSLFIDMTTATESSYTEHLFPTGTSVFMTADDGLHGTEMWEYHSQTGDATLIDIYSGVGSSNPNDYIRFGDYLMFSCIDSTYQFWSRHINSGALQPVTSSTTTNSGPSFAPYGATICNGMVNIVAGLVPEGAIYATNGTLASTTLVVDGLNGNILHPICYNGDLYFTSGNTHLYRSDGTAASTTLVRNFAQNTPSGSVNGLIEFNGHLFFSATDTDHGTELWVSDGTSASTHLFMDLLPGTGNSYPTYFTVAGNFLYFTAVDANNQRLIWVTDGTESGTFPLALPSPITGGIQLASADSLLYFSKTFTAGPGYTTELWRFDGTIDGTIMLHQFYHENSDLSRLLFTWKNQLFFRGVDNLHGVELWTSDGTIEHTKLLQDICPGPCSSLPGNFSSQDSTIYFTAFRTDIGYEPWFLHLGLVTAEEVDRAQNSIQVLGNPVINQQLTIQVQMDQPSELSFCLWSADGRSVWQQTEHMVIMDTTLHLDLPLLSPGMYYLEVSGTKVHIVSKLVILK